MFCDNDPINGRDWMGLLPGDCLADKGVRKYATESQIQAIEQSQAVLGQSLAIGSEYTLGTILAFAPEPTSKGAAALLFAHATDQLKQLTSNDGKGYFQIAMEEYYGTDDPSIRGSVTLWNFSTLPINVGAGLPPAIQGMKLETLLWNAESIETKAVTTVANSTTLSTVNESSSTLSRATTVESTSSSAGGTARVCNATESTSANSSLLQRYRNGSGGRWGSSSTRSLNDEIATFFEDNGFKNISGAGRRSEEWIPGPGWGTKGGTWVDITIQLDGYAIRIQTISTLADGLTPTAAEAAAAARIRAVFPNDILILVPK